MTEIQILEGPLDDGALASVASLYGRFDPKYSQPAFLRHLFRDNPYEWSLHSFARDGDELVGHCAVVPMKARVAGDIAKSGKVEAFFVDEAYRRRPSAARGPSLGFEILSALTKAAREAGVDPLHAYISARVGAIFERDGYQPFVVGDRAHALVTRGSSETSGRNALLIDSLGTAQSATAFVARHATRTGHLRVDSPDESDAELVAIPDPGEATWTITGADAWSWYIQSSFVYALQVDGRAGWRAVVFSEAKGKPVHLLGWRPNQPGVTAAASLLAGLAQFARARSAPSARVQPWPGLAHADHITRACRLMAWAPRERFVIYVNSDTAPADVEPSPFFYVTF